MPRVGVEAGQGDRVRCVEGHGEQRRLCAQAVLLAQVERVAGRVGQRDPVGAVGQVGGAQLDRPLGGLLIAVDLQIKVELLRPLLAWPLRADMVGRLLEGDLLAVRGPEGDPVGDLAGDVPPGEFGVERGQLLDVRGVEGDELELSCHGHGPILPPTTDSGHRGGSTPTGQRRPVNATRQRGPVNGSGQRKSRPRVWPAVVTRPGS